MMSTRFTLEVQPEIPERLSGLAELADDLLYSWKPDVRRLFWRLDTELWHACRHNPRIFLRRVSQELLDAAAEDPDYLAAYDAVAESVRAYRSGPVRQEVSDHLDPERDLVAYLCMEYGFHESLRLYSGGLGVLAGDHCKAASDLGVPFVGVGMLYHQGYFDQRIDADGRQIDTYAIAELPDLPVERARDDGGGEITVDIALPGRAVRLAVWRLRAGRVHVYLLDSDIEANRPEDRDITYQLYGGGDERRLQQEIVLGVGGVRALRALGLRPTVWHINEGHSALQILERCRERVEEGLDFAAALERVAAATVFTTHTPVPAGHDVFEAEQMRRYFEGWPEALGIDADRLVALGRADHREGFGMTALALRGSRFRNGVSRIHGSVARSMEGHLWPHVPDDEVPIGSVTNGVHAPTFLAREWASAFDDHLGEGWRRDLGGKLERLDLDALPDDVIRQVRRGLKVEMLRTVRQRAVERYRRLELSEERVRRSLRWLDPDDPEVLILGFARRFAAYKRADLLLRDRAAFEELATDPDRPVVLLYAGKAHPRDDVGKDLLRAIHQVSMTEPLIGHVVLLEDYDLDLARKLVRGVDVWVNTPRYPLEASGTSGMKAGINGTLNLSVLDGWWAEGFDGDNGWGIQPHPDATPEEQDRLEGEATLRTLREEVVPIYYDDGGPRPSTRWLQRARTSIATLLPHFTAERMLLEYVRDYYGRAARQAEALGADGARGARELAEWRRRTEAAWPDVRLRRLDDVVDAVPIGEGLILEVAVATAGLAADEIVVECLAVRPGERGDDLQRTQLTHTGNTDGGEAIFEARLEPSGSGVWEYEVRAYPHHPLLPHRLETGLLTYL